MKQDKYVGWGPAQYQAHIEGLERIAYISLENEKLMLERYESANRDRIRRADERSKIAGQLWAHGLLLNPDGTISPMPKQGDQDVGQV